jgi:hypothetical protein
MERHVSFTGLLKYQIITHHKSCKRDISCLALKGSIFAEILVAILKGTAPRSAPLASQPNRFWREGFPFPFIKYSMLQATVMLPGTDKAGGRLVDMNYELK